MCRARKIIKVLPGAAGSDMPLGTITDYVLPGPLPTGWVEPQGQVYRMQDYPGFWLVVGRTYVPRPRENPLQRAARRLFRLAGPADGLRPDEGRLPDLRPLKPKRTRR